MDLINSTGKYHLFCLHNLIRCLKNNEFLSFNKRINPIKEIILESKKTKWLF